MTTLTRELILQRLSRKPKKVDVEGWGEVYIRPIPEVKRSSRSFSYYDETGGRTKEADLRRVHGIIDQVVDENGEPLFTDADIEALSADSFALDSLVEAVAKFNGEDEKNEQGESSDISES